ncbi:MAG: hypothetical protein AUK47_17295 [Deltaproteobacteria bacterium CG2_30_63_29]|nr:MAG: hypothetical protein AUK47_17295 [Deltaproteobacteria bacterium CG2_30_63_29]
MTLLLLALVVFLAFVIESTLGFGATVVTVTLGVSLAPLDQLLPAFVPVNILLSSALVWRNRQHVDRTMLLCRILPAMVCGVPFGMLWFQYGDDRWVLLGFGLFVVGLSTLELLRIFRPRSEHVAPLGPLTRFGMLFAGGVIHGAYATGGPLAVYVAGRDLPDKSVFRATLSSLWLVLNLLLIAGYLFSGDLTRDTATLSLVLLVPLVLGLGAGDWLHHRANARTFRIAVFVLLGAAGLILATK